MIMENFRLAFQSLRGSKIRTFLTVVGVVIGINFVVIIVSIFNGIESDIKGEIASFGSNLISVNPGDVLKRGKDGKISFNPVASLGTSTLTEKDLKDVSQIEGVVAAAPQMLVSGVVSVRGKTVDNSLIFASNEDYPEAFNQKVETGNFFTPGVGTAKVVVIGQGIADSHFAGRDPIGGIITIRGEKFIVIGVMENYDSATAASFGVDINRVVIVPLATGKRFNNGVPFIQEIDLKAANEEVINRLVKDIEAKLLANHGGEKDFTVVTQKDILSAVNQISASITTGAWLFSIVGLMISGISILNIMLVTVTERTKEIGLRKALGASNGEILQQFVIESFLIGVTGGIIGVALAWVEAGLIAHYTSINPDIRFDNVMLALSVAAAAGIVFGLFPAWKASRQQPIEALRYE